uniref:Sodium channel regulatory subunit beta-2 n=1 Tax=Papio anubis TaxID=9555 RepID=A0A8I5NRM5_PAPAN
MHRDAWLPRPAFSLTGLSLFFSLVPPGRSMEVTVPATLNVLNGSDARLPCTFNSCYTVNHKQFSLNWTYQGCNNCSEEMFLQFRMKIINLKLERFQDRVEFSGNPSKYDVSVMLRNVQPEDEGIYNCYIMNPPDRHRGHGKIHLQVIMEGEGWGASCGALTFPTHLLSAALAQGTLGRPCLPEGGSNHLCCIEGIHFLPSSLQEPGNMSQRVLVMI